MCGLIPKTNNNKKKYHFGYYIGSNYSNFFLSLISNVHLVKVVGLLEFKCSFAKIVIGTKMAN